MPQPARGCFLFCTAPVEAITHPEILGDLNGLMREIDALFETKFREAQTNGQFPAGVDVEVAAKMAQATLHTLAVRARSGESKAALKKLVHYAVPLLCYSAGHTR